MIKLALKILNRLRFTKIIGSLRIFCAVLFLESIYSLWFIVRFMAISTAILPIYWGLWPLIKWFVDRETLSITPISTSSTHSHNRIIVTVSNHAHTSTATLIWWFHSATQVMGPLPVAPPSPAQSINPEVSQQSHQPSQMRISVINQEQSLAGSASQILQS